MVLARRRNPTQGLGSVKRSPAVLYAEGVGARAFGGEGQAKVSEGAEGGHHFVGDTVFVYNHEATDQEAALGNGLTIRPGAQDDVVLVALGARGGNDGAEPVQVVEAGGRQTGTWHGSTALRANVEESAGRGREIDAERGGFCGRHRGKRHTVAQAMYLSQAAFLAERGST